MADKRQKQSYGGYSSDSASLELYDSVKQLAESDLEKEFLTYDELLFKLRRWWCQHYKRPYKDPLLDSYTFEELLFEYFDITKEFNRKPHEVKVAEEVETSDRDWAAEEDAREGEELNAASNPKAFAADDAPLENDTIVEEAVGLTDPQWAAKHDTSAKVLINPTADQVDNEGGDISTSFGE